MTTPHRPPWSATAQQPPHDDMQALRNLSAALITWHPSIIVAGGVTAGDIVASIDRALFLLAKTE